MPLIIPKDLPAYEELQQENVFVMHQERAMSQHKIGRASCRERV